MAAIVESQRGLVGKGTYQVLGSLTMVALGAAFLSEATKALVSETPKRYLGETMKMRLAPVLPASWPAATPSMKVLGTIETQYLFTKSGSVVSW